MAWLRPLRFSFTAAPLGMSRGSVTRSLSTVRSARRPTPSTPDHLHDLDPSHFASSPLPIREYPDDDVNIPNGGDALQTQLPFPTKDLPSPITFTPSQIHEVRWLFSGPIEAGQISSVELLEELPRELPEIVFLGRSNVGKSALMNALLGSSIAKVSSRPGMTQAIHFYELRSQLRLVDLPGFGYAQLGRIEQARLSKLLQRFLGLDDPSLIKAGTKKIRVPGPPSIRLAALLVDSRRGAISERSVLESLDRIGVPILLVLTKVDKLKPSEIASAIDEAESELRRHPHCYSEVVVTSSLTKQGIERLQLLAHLSTRAVSLRPGGEVAPLSDGSNSDRKMPRPTSRQRPTGQQ